MRHRTLLSILILALVAGSAGASTRVDAFMTGFVDEIRSTLNAGDARKANEMFVEHFDMPLFGKRCLIDHWKEFDDSERERFLSLLDLNMRKRLREKLLFTRDDVDFELRTKRVERREDGLITVINSLNIKKGELKLVLTLTRAKGGYRIVDYELEGALLSRNYRGHFNYLMRNYGKDGLFERMERKLGSS